MRFLSETPATSPHLLTELAAWSALYGADPMLTQGAGGNTSVKDDGWLWVKASGAWLEHAQTKETFVPVPVTTILEGLNNGEDRKAEWMAPSGRVLRSSIETSLHAVVPDRWVFHLHTVHSMLWSAMEDGQSGVADRLGGLPWAWVPYGRPGLPLTRAIVEQLGNKPQVLLLENHGLVVSGGSCQEVNELLLETERRLSLPARQAALSDLEELAAARPERYHVARYAGAHQCAMVPGAFEAAIKGMPAPDFAVFLGARLVAIRRGQSIADAAMAYRGEFGIEPAVFLLEGQGALVRDSVSDNGEQMLEALGQMLVRLPKGARLRYLPIPEILGLLDWDAEKYRQSLIE